MKKNTVKNAILLLLVALFPTFILAQIPEGYYSRAIGKSGRELQDSLHQIIKGHTRIAYDDLWPYFLLTDPSPDDSSRIMDIYTNCTFAVGQHGQTGSDYCEIYNREHGFCQSWMGVSNYTHASEPCRSDLHHIYPVDSRMNSTRNNNPFSIVDTQNASYNEYENGSRLGRNAYFSVTDSFRYEGNVFEPIDEYKGDIARSMLYMSVRYLHEDDYFTDSYGMNVKSQLRPWALELMMAWHRLDPVSEKEINRNNAIYYQIQNNRNPFIDHPELVELIWGNDSATSTFQETYVPVVRPRLVDHTISAGDDGVTVTLAFDSVMRISSLTQLTNYYLGSYAADSVRVLNSRNVTVHFPATLVTGATYRLLVRRCQTQLSRTFMADTTLGVQYGSPVLAAWTFDSLPRLWMDSLRTIPANYGRLSVDAQILFNGQSGSDSITSSHFQYYGGDVLGDPRETPAATNALCLTGGGAPRFVLQFSTQEYHGIQLKYALRRTPTAYCRFLHEWSADGVNFHPIGDTLALSESNSFNLYLHDLAPFSEIDGLERAFIRISMDGATSSQGNVRFDNICLHGIKCADSVAFHAEECHSYIWYGREYTASGAYARNFEREAGCDSTEVLYLDIYGPNAQIAGPEAITIGQSATLTATGGSNILWSTGETTATIVVSPSETTTYSVVITNGDDDCADTAYWRLEVTNGIAESSCDIAIYPNPASESLTIKGEEMCRVEIYSLEGQLVMAKEVAGSGCVLSTEGLPSGTYVAAVYMRTGEVVRRKIAVVR